MRRARRLSAIVLLAMSFGFPHASYSRQPPSRTAPLAEKSGSSPELEVYSLKRPMPLYRVELNISNEETIPNFNTPTGIPMIKKQIITAVVETPDKLNPTEHRVRFFPSRKHFYVFNGRKYFPVHILDAKQMRVERFLEGRKHKFAISDKEEPELKK